MIPVERRQIILEMVAEKGIVSIAELTDRMNVSHMTIRRDLQKLEQQGAVVLVSGGVQSPGRVAHEPSHTGKNCAGNERKKRLLASWRQVLFSREAVSIWMRERPR